jgi:hypothetical protein
MYRFRLLILLAIVWIVLSLNIERPDDILDLGNINLAPSVYIITVASMAMVLIVPELNYVPAAIELAVILMVYLLARLGLEGHRLSFIFGHYLTLIDILVISTTLVLARKVSQSLNRFENEIDKTILDSADFNHLYHEHMISDELLRARRYQHTVVLLYLQFKTLPALKGNFISRWSRMKRLENRYLRTYIIKLIKDLLLDDCDIIAWHKGDLLICLPEKNLVETSELIHNLEELCQVVLNIRVTIGSAVFPHDALVAFDLVRAANKRSQQTAPPRIAAPKQKARHIIGDIQRVDGEAV